MKFMDQWWSSGGLGLMEWVDWWNGIDGTDGWYG